MTDVEYFQRQYDVAQIDLEQLRTAQRRARTPERIAYLQEEVAICEQRLKRIDDQLARIRRVNREG